MSKQDKLNNMYVKGIESHNDELDTKNCKISSENERLKEQIKQLQGINNDFSACLGILLERYGWVDQDIGKVINETLSMVTKKLAGKKY